MLIVKVIDIGMEVQQGQLCDCIRSRFHALVFVSGLVYIADTVDISLLAPRKKITVMLMGNHSAGKSSFINW